MSVKKKIINNGIASTLQKGVKVAEQLLLVPFFISAWGAAYYGEWLTLTIIPTMLGFSDMGFGSAAANSYVLNYASGNKQKAADIAKNGFFTITLIILAGILLTILSLILLSYFQIFDKSLIPAFDAIIALSLLLFARLIGFYNPLCEAFFKAKRRVAFSININTIYSAACLGASMLVLILKGNIIQFALVNATISIVYALVYYLLATNTLKTDEKITAQIDRTLIVQLLKKGLGYLLSPIWQAIFFQGTTFVVRLTLGPVAVTIFNTVRSLTRAVNQANAIAIGAVMPEIQYELGANNRAKAKKIFTTTFVLVAAIALSGIVFLYFLGPMFYEWWTHKALTPPAAMWNIFLIGILFNALWWLSGDVLISANKPYAFTLPASIVAVFSVLITYLCATHWGLAGAAMGSLLLDITLFALIIPKTIRLLKK